MLLSACGENTDIEESYEKNYSDTVTEQDYDPVPVIDEYVPVVFTCNDEYLMHALAFGRNPSRGVWNGNIYTNEYLGLWFYMPYTWIALPNGVLRWESQLRNDGEMPEAGALLTDEWLRSVGGLYIYDMSVINYRTEASVSIYFTQFRYPEVPKFASEGRSLSPPRIELPTFINTPGTIRIGQYYWHLIRDEWGSRRDHTSGSYVYSYRYKFINVQGLFARSIVIFRNSYSESLEDILRMFGCISTTPMPAPTSVLSERSTWQQSIWPEFELPRVNHPIIDTWTRKDDDSFFYIFGDDGLGWSSSNLPAYLWMIDGDQLRLFIAYSGDERSYTFTIEGDTLTLKGMYSVTYTREQHPLIGTWVSENNLAYVFRIGGYGNIESTNAHWWWEPFSWAIENEQLLILYDYEFEAIYTFSINDNVLTFMNPELPNEYIAFIREEAVTLMPGLPEPSPPPIGHPLIGRWVDEEEESMIFIFEADGVGSMIDFPRWTNTIRNEPFVWTIEDDFLTMFFEFTGAEDATFTIYGATLTLYGDEFVDGYERFIRQS